MDPSPFEVNWFEPTDASWIELIQQHPRSNLFHHPVWLEVLSRSYSYEPRLVGISSSTGSMIAGLPLMIVKNLNQRKKWVSLPFSDHCEPLCVDEQMLTQITSGLVRLAELEDITSVELRWKYPQQNTVQHSSDYILSRVQLSENKEEVAKLIKPKHFRQIKVAYERGVRVKRNDSLEGLHQFYTLHVQTRRRKGLPVQPWRFFREIYHSIIQRDLGFILLAYADNPKQIDGMNKKDPFCVAGAVFFHWNRTLTYKYAASKEEARPLLAMDAILWWAIQWGCEHQFEWIDMGRTEIENEGLRGFKRRWGAEETPLYYSQLSDGPKGLANPSNKNWIQTVIRYSPIWVCRAAGELFYKYYG